ncbi:hypothetical protein NQ314_001759 [Rhamnusium bicolor]|uniref:Uncharacterized protein n=1 Tax=Rhamnusium bicolor TaxID=1586634 RepID=A0AAV8ZRC9_9CUCU|nr:hypothetical protein NQ314_001759 [Rhamnusium bicolor]
MYEPVKDRCVTTTIIKPTKYPNGACAINGYKDRKDLSPPEKPPRRYSRVQRQLIRQESREAIGNLKLEQFIRSYLASHMLREESPIPMFALSRTDTAMQSAGARGSKSGAC